MTKGKKKWLTAVLAALAAAATVVVPQLAGPVELVLSVVGQLLIGSEEAPRVVPLEVEPKSFGSSSSTSLLGSDAIRLAG